MEKSLFYFSYGSSRYYYSYYIHLLSYDQGFYDGFPEL